MTYSTNTVCKIVGVTKKTLFKWEELGLISNPGRDYNNWRVYNEHDLTAIKEVADSKGLL